MTVGPELYREIMATFPTGVAVVTAPGSDGSAKGLTVSAFCPVSLNPPLVLVCIDKTSNTLPAVRSAGGFTVNLLRAGREDLARRFASKAEDKFAEVQWDPAPIPEAGPILTSDVVAYAVCKVQSTAEAGDHWIFVGSVEAGGRDKEATPLVYGGRTFTAWQASAPGSSDLSP